MSGPALLTVIVDLDVTREGQLQHVDVVPRGLDCTGPGAQTLSSADLAAALRATADVLDDPALELGGKVRISTRTDG